ncbi:hypothetical protein [uncultured Tateyamaria sp.]|uniref:hypothetical protein n=1 Tax=uncultured Tateyamaria sp. TaxID=455651 RepID=UPI00263467F7|nr:hypothetical protein [uncultured Tateyamaria sp.]
MAHKTIIPLVMAAGLLSACAEPGTGLKAYSGPDDYIAIAADRGIDSTASRNDNAGIAITPDGCQTWYIDDGVEARASNRLDPVSGLPVCSAAAAPGTVLGPYRSGTQGVRDRVPRRPANVRTEQVVVRQTKGHGHVVHPVETPHN